MHARERLISLSCCPCVGVVSGPPYTAQGIGTAASDDSRIAPITVNHRLPLRFIPTFPALADRAECDEAELAQRAPFEPLCCGQRGVQKLCHFLVSAYARRGPKP